MIVEATRGWLTVLTWATAFPAIRVGLDGYSPWALGLLRLAAASAVLLPVVVFARPRLPSGRQWGRVLLCGILGQTLYQGFLMTGEVSVPPGTASVLIATAPIFSVLHSTLAALFLGVVPSALGYLVWSYALARITIARSTVALYLVPVVAMGISWLWLGEQPTLLAVIGGVIAIGGVVLVRSEGSMRRRQPVLSGSVGD